MEWFYAQFGDCINAENQHGFADRSDKQHGPQSDAFGDEDALGNESSFGNGNAFGKENAFGNENAFGYANYQRPTADYGKNQYEDPTYHNSAFTYQENESQVGWGQNYDFWQQQHFHGHNRTSSWPTKEPSYQSKRFSQERANETEEGPSTWNSMHKARQSNELFGVIGSRFKSATHKQQQQDEKPIVSSGFLENDECFQLQMKKNTVSQEIAFLEGRIRWEVENGEKELKQEYNKIDGMYVSNINTLGNDLTRNETFVVNADSMIADIQQKMSNISDRLSDVTEQISNYEDTLIKQERQIEDKSNALGKETNEILANIFQLELQMKDERNIHDELIEDIEETQKIVEKNIVDTNKSIKDVMSEIKKKHKLLLQKVVGSKKVINALENENSSLAEHLRKKKKASLGQRIVKFFKRRQ